MSGPAAGRETDAPAVACSDHNHKHDTGKELSGLRQVAVSAFV